MENEEAIHRIQEHMRVHKMGQYPHELIKVALDMAIEALQEQQVCRKPLRAFLEPMDRYKGLKGKFLVFKSDTGEMIKNCFVLRPDKDPAAVAALRAYAAATDNNSLSADLINWVGAWEQEQLRWIPVTERLPKCGERVLATDGGFVGEFYINKCGQWQRYNVNDYSLLMALDILFWIPMPEPPKEDA